MSSVISELNEYFPLDLAKFIYDFINPYTFIETKTENYIHKCYPCKKNLKYCHYLKHKNNEIHYYGKNCLLKLFKTEKIETEEEFNKRLGCIQCGILRDKTEFHEHGLRASGSYCFSCWSENTARNEEERKKREQEALRLFEDKKKREDIQRLRTNICINCHILFDILPQQKKYRIRCNKCYAKYKSMEKITKKGKDPNQIVIRHYEKCNKTFDRIRWEKFKTRCIGCYKR